MSRLRVGIVGVGFIGRAHVDAARRIPGVDVVAIAGSSLKRARQQADVLDVPMAYGEYRDLLADPGIDVVHNCTPNALHFDVNRATLEAGKACFSEKPLTVTRAEAMALAELRRKSGLAAAVNFHHRAFPQVQQARALVANGRLGSVHAVHGSYLQDWLLLESDWNWRLDPVCGGPSRAIADIGSHWMDLAQHVAAARIIEVMADLATVVPVHYRPAGPVETFQRTAGAAERRVATSVDTEDFGSVLLRFESGARGVFTVSQVSAGRKNRLLVEVDGTCAAIAWSSEQSEYLWLGTRTEPSQVGQRDPSQSLVPGTQILPTGHAEGWNDAIRTAIAGFYEVVRGGSPPPWLATFEDGLRAVALTEAILQSSRERRWVPLGKLAAS